MVDSEQLWNAGRVSGAGISKVQAINDAIDEPSLCVDALNLAGRNLTMKTIISAIIGACIATSSFAESRIFAGSPIPDNAENRFCYFAGLAYSENAFILLTGTNPANLNVSQAASSTRERLQRCVRGDDGNLSWRPESQMQIAR